MGIDTQTKRAQAVIREAYADALVQKKLSEDGRVSLSCDEIAHRIGESPSYVDTVLRAVFAGSGVKVKRIELQDDPR